MKKKRWDNAAQAMFDWPGLSVLWVVLVLVLVVVVVVVVVLELDALELSLELPLAPAAPAAAPVASDWPSPPPGFSVDDCMYLGISMGLSTGWIRSSCSVKLKSGGNSRPLGSRVPCSRSSWKNECAHACNGVIRNEGVYSSSRATRSIASGGVRALNTWKQSYRRIHHNTCYYSRKIRRFTILFVSLRSHFCLLLPFICKVAF